MKLSALERKQTIEQVQASKYDLIIIGGGITGAGIAWDAASRGLKTILIEKQDFAAGTSSRSTKLIHGGLRYLKQLEVSLVREVGLERAVIHNAAPHLVVPKKMLLPIIEKGSLGQNSTSVALMVYDLLAGVEKDERRKMVTKEEVSNLEPLLRTDILKGGGLYYEYRTDDARLTIEVMKTAKEHGALALNYCQAVGFNYNKKNKVKGIRVVDHLNKQAFNIKGKVVVNAAGPWVDKVRQRDAFVKGKRLHLTKGVHVVVPYERLPLQQSAYFDVPGGRMMFAIPRANVTYIGTTDTTYSARIERPKVSKEDVDYILNGVNNLFPTVNLGKKDVISTWAGLRPLIHEDGKSPSELSRKDEIFFSKSGIISIAGGKLTGFRKMAERTVDEVMKALYKKNGKMPKDCITEGMCLSGGDFESASAIEDYIDTMATSLSVMNISRGQITDLVYKYGSNTPQILQNFRRQSSTEIAQKYNIAERLVIAELHYGIEHEMVHTSSDFFIRRTGRLYFERLDIPKYRALVGQILAQVFEWDEAQIAADEVEFDQEYLDVVNFI